MKNTNKEKIEELEIFAINEYFDINHISVKDYINAEVMGILKYQAYIDLYAKQYGECFECEQKPCDEGCGYQVDK